MNGYFHGAEHVRFVLRQLLRRMSSFLYLSGPKVVAVVAILDCGDVAYDLFAPASPVHRDVWSKVLKSSKKR